MPLANQLGIVVSLSDDGTGVIELEHGGIPVTFEADDVSSEFTREDVGPIEVGKLVRVWAVKLPIHPTHTATLVESNVEPLTGLQLLLAMLSQDDSLACIKGMLDPMSHASRERLDASLEASWADYTDEAEQSSSSTERS
jgi:hypothetical protein